MKTDCLIFKADGIEDGSESENYLWYLNRLSFESEIYGWRFSNKHEFEHKIPNCFLKVKTLGKTSVIVLLKNQLIMNVKRMM